jgi:hypothetical protein
MHRRAFLKASSTTAGAIAVNSLARRSASGPRADKSDKARIDNIDGDHTIASKAERQRREVVIPK